MSSQRTEAATPRRRAEARRRGNVARSQDLTAAVSLIAGFLAATVTLPRAFSALAAFLARTLGDLATIAADPDGFRRTLVEGALAGGTAIGPIVVATAAAGIAATMVQTGGLFSAAPLEPRAERLNPLRGLERMFSRRALVEGAKGVAKIAVMAAVALAVVRDVLPRLAAAVGQDPASLLGLMGATLFQLLGRGAVVLLAIGGLDYLYQRIEWERSLRMTKEEVREDLRETEGDPLVRARQRSRQRDLARRRMMSDVQRATVVVTNPLHIAVALRYAPAEMAAPTVVAKGARLVADRIRAIAARCGIPVVENRPLAHALYRSVPVGRQIPPALYHAVAEVLAAVYRLARQRGVRA